MKKASLVIALALGVAACGDKSEGTTGGEASGSNKPATASGSNKPATPTSDAKPKPAEPNYVASAFALGRAYGFAMAFQMVDKADETAKKMAQVKKEAEVLGIDPPAEPKKDEKADAAEKKISDAVKAKRGDAAAAAFDLGAKLTDAWFGAQLGAKVDAMLPDIEKALKASGIAESVYKDKWDAVKAKPSDETLSAFAKALEASFKS